MGPPERPSLQMQPQMTQIQDTTKADRLTAIQSRVSDETRDLLLRFGRRRVFSSGGFSQPGTVGALNLQNFGGNL